MAITIDTVIEIAPELATEDPARINTFIGYASCFVDPNFFRCSADFAHALLTAHFLTMSNRGSAGGGGAGSGPITGEKVGDLSRNYGSSSSGSGSVSTSSLEQTSYGSQFLFARKSCIVTPMVIC